jgi:hypothetical protein
MHAEAKVLDDRFVQVGPVPTAEEKLLEFLSVIRSYQVTR